ncbi:MAG TPA: transketolase [Halanaerobiales bacterium]|nr:transketolase [Halanaerobiales bacterium]
MYKTLDLKSKAAEIRIDLLKMIHNSGMGHTGSSLSNTDILVTLYYSVMNIRSDEPEWEGRDRFILSKGHGVESYYCILADLGFIEKKELNTFCQYNTRLIGHPNNKVPGVEMNTGALGHGLSIATGIAKAAQMDDCSYRVFALMGDGELAEGSIWEAAMAAAHFKLDNLTGIIDRNKLQISGSTEEVMSLDPLSDKWKSFGWEVVEVNGHDYQELNTVLSKVPLKKGKPTLILASTVKGRGVSFIENQADWHHRVPTAEELDRALKELSSAGVDLDD